MQPVSLNIIVTCTICFLLTMGTYAQNKQASLGTSTNSVLTQQSEVTALQKLQSSVDANFQDVTLYEKTHAERDAGQSEIAETSKRVAQLSDSLAMITRTIATFNNDSGQVSLRSKLQALMAHYLTVLRYEVEENRLSEDLQKLKLRNKQLDSLIKKFGEKHSIASNLLHTLSKTLSGAGLLNVQGVQYRFFVVRSNQHTVRIHNSQHLPSSIMSLQKIMEKRSVPLMITNAGMFDPNYDPQGLLIQEGVLQHPMDTFQPVKSDLNFYLLPNGIFHISKNGRFGISETLCYKKLLAQNAKEKPFYATQSGPLLLLEGKLNKHFKAGSGNTNIRSGVGIVDDNHVVFLISDTKVNFHDFAVAFKGIFGCQTALYLDGAISEMFLSQNITDNQKIPDERLGPLISVTSKN